MGAYQRVAGGYYGSTTTTNQNTAIRAMSPAGRWALASC